MRTNERIKTCTMVASGLVACLVIGGSGSVSAFAQQRPPAAEHVTAGRTLAGNRELARKQAAWLLSKVPLPRGAVGLKKAPSSLPGPAMGTPAVSTLIDTARSWRIAVPFTKMAAWLTKHRPRGLPQVGSTTMTDRGKVVMVGYGYRGRSSKAWQSSELDIGVAPAGKNASVMRADGVVVYLDPRPVPDNAKGPRLRVTPASGCPRSDNGIVGVRNHGAGLRRHLLPSGKPVAGLICRYYGLNTKPWRLHRVIRMRAASARRLARSLQKIPLSHTDGGFISCPADDGSAEVIALVYPHRGTIDLFETLNGCRSVANGFIVAGME
jgi:hypothetical protein